MRKHKALILLINISYILFTASCSSGLGFERPESRRFSSGADTERYMADYDILDKGPVSGGVLNIFSTEPDSLNPILTRNSYVSDFLGFVYEGLTRLNEKQQAVGVLSDSWSVSDDGLVWTFHIRNGVKWHDGQPLTAEDVEFTIKTLLNPGIETIYKPLLLNVATFAAVDSSNINLVLEKPNSFMPEMMTFPIIPKHQFNQKDVLTASRDFIPVGTGPYEFLSQSEGKTVELKRNLNWWYPGIDGNSAEDGMYIERINLKIYKNPDDAMAAFQEGEIDVAVVRAADLYKYKGRTDVIIKKYTSRDFEFLSFNLKNPVLADPHARLAISAAIDKDELIDYIGRGEVEASELPILPDSWANDNDGIYADNPSLTPKEILETGGWKESKQGYYKLIGGVRRYLKVEIIVNSNNNLRIEMAQKICSQLEKAGILSACTAIDWNEFITRLNNAKFDIAFTGCRVPQIPDISFLYSVSYLPVSLPAKRDSARNVSGYQNMQVDEYIKNIFRENDPNRKKAIYRNARQLINNDMPYLGLFFLRNAMVYSKNIRGPMNPDTWNLYNDMTHWYITGQL